MLTSLSKKCRLQELYHFISKN